MIAIEQSHEIGCRPAEDLGYGQYGPGEGDLEERDRETQIQSEVSISWSCSMAWMVH